MPAVMIRCPETGQGVSTGIETEPSELERFPQVASTILCPACGQEHVWIARDAWIDDPAAEDASPALPATGTG